MLLAAAVGRQFQTHGAIQSHRRPRPLPDCAATADWASAARHHLQAGTPTMSTSYDGDVAPSTLTIVPQIPAYGIIAEIDSSTGDVVQLLQVRMCASASATRALA